ncbi:MAG: TnpV protein, partial [Firmicutes bacterium]|nr:TnpV protein [Bacillota bacterium]
MNELTYRQRGDYLLPELSMDGLEMQTLGKYGLLRRKYLR